MSLFGCEQVIDVPTRITPNSSSLIDHVVTNVKDLVQESGIINIGFSDHLVTYCTRKLQKSIFSSHSVKRIRNMKFYSGQFLVAELSKIDWSLILSSSNVDYCVKEFSRLFISAVDKVAPYREIRVRKNSSPWMNGIILASIKKRDRLFSRYKSDKGNGTLYKEYCRVRNAVQRDIKQAKEIYFRNKVERNKDNSGKLWAHLNSLGFSKKSPGSACKIVLEENGTKVFNSSCVARIFNKFYTSVASDLVSRLPNPLGVFSTDGSIFKRFYSGKVGSRPLFTLSPVSSHFIRKQLKSLDPKKAIGLDGLSPRFLRDATDTITPLVTHIINLSILTETVPSAFKEAKVVPLFKKGSKLDPGNYRPVSILSTMSKIMERAVHSQLNEYLSKRGILCENQSGFRGGFSTDSCLIGLSDYVKGEIGRGNLVGMVLIDLQKAFDTVNHRILLDKLHAIGMSSSSVSWFGSYLTDRSQCVEVDGVRSDFSPISCGVPQGSILGPQLFLIYINDMNASIDCKLSLYADDSALLFSHSNADVIGKNLSSALSNCKKWLVDNRLSLHLGKTECILFGSKRRLKGCENFHVTCDGNVIGRVFDVRYLGVQLDANMNGSCHANNVLKTCSQRLSFLYRNRTFLDERCRRLLCSALIQPYLDYCCSSWFSGLSSALKKRLEVTQRKMVRFIHGMDFRQHVGLVDLRKLSWLSVPDRVVYFKLLHLFRVRHGIAPKYLMTNFKAVSEAHSHNTRSSSHNYFVSRDLSLSPSSFAFSAIKAWNSLPLALKNVDKIDRFKRDLKQHFFEGYIE